MEASFKSFILFNQIGNHKNRIKLMKTQCRNHPHLTESSAHNYASPEASSSNAAFSYTADFIKQKFVDAQPASIEF